MRRMLMAIMGGLLLATSVSAQDVSKNWTTLSLSVVEKVDGELAPEPRATIMNYIDGKGIGWHLGEASSGPVASILMWERTSFTWGSDVSMALYFQGSADLLGGADGASILHTGLMGPDFRVGYSGLGGVELSVAPLWKFSEGASTEWWPTVALVFRTGG